MVSHQTLLVCAGVGGAAALAGIYHYIAARGLPSGPPVVRGWIPFVGCGLAFVRNPNKFFEQCREAHGDTFIVYLFGIKMLCVFSNVGLRSLYTVREADASFTEATRGLLGLKLPEEIIAEGDLRKFHAGLKRPLLPTYMRYIERAALDTISALPARGEFDVFVHMKELMHRVGFYAWVGPEAAAPEYFSRLVAAFEVLDVETSFKDLRSLVSTWATGKRRERAAMADMRDVLAEIWHKREARIARHEEVGEDNLTVLHSLYADLPQADREERVARDVFHFHLASLANMYAALSWTLVRLLDSGLVPAVQAELAVLQEAHGPQFYFDDDVLENGLKKFESIFQESLRLAQQSITLRKVLKPVDFDVDGMTVHVPPGYYIATLLSVTNTLPTLVPPCARAATEFFPDRYDGAALKSAAPAYGVSTFGHGAHACPGQRFALHASKVVFSIYLTQLSISPVQLTVSVPATSVGAIGRAAGPCVVSFAKKESS